MNDYHPAGDMRPMITREVDPAEAQRASVRDAVLRSLSGQFGPPEFCEARALNNR